ncbi:MAG TPA: hypothetical protein VHS58_09500, partial [Acetobacteraceae bacterium]|nr:hypothetical protein [Acetobacteraceae bacterium]
HDEAVALRRVEPLNFSGSHSLCLAHSRRPQDRARRRTIVPLVLEGTRERRPESQNSIATTI